MRDVDLGLACFGTSICRARFRTAHLNGYIHREVFINIQLCWDIRILGGGERVGQCDERW